MGRRFALITVVEVSRTFREVTLSDTQPPGHFNPFLDRLGGAMFK